MLYNNRHDEIFGHGDCHRNNRVRLFGGAYRKVRQADYSPDKLYHSITLVELKTRKIFYWVFAVIIGFLIFYTVMQMADPAAPSVTEFNKIFGVGRLHTNIALMFALIVLIASEAFIITLGVSKNAVVDKGVYTNFDMLDWHQVRDYIIDEERGILVLSSDKATFSRSNI